MYLAYDTETTGLSSNCQVLTAYFIVLDKELNVVDTLDLKIKYDKYNIQPRAMEINKINMEEHEKSADTLEEAKSKFEFFLDKNKMDNKFIAFGHNISYDIRMLKSNNILTCDLEDKYFSKETLDTIEIAKDKRNDGFISPKQSLSLEKLCYSLDVNCKSDKLHNAEYDILLTIELYKKLVKF